MLSKTGDKNDSDGIDTPSTSLINDIPEPYDARTPLPSRRRLLSSRISQINKEYLIDNNEAHNIPPTNMHTA